MESRPIKKKLKKVASDFRPIKSGTRAMLVNFRPTTFNFGLIKSAFGVVLLGLGTMASIFLFNSHLFRFVSAGIICAATPRFALN